MVIVSKGTVQISITIVLIGIYFITNGWICLILALIILIFLLITNLNEHQTRTREIQNWNVKKPVDSSRKHENKKLNYSFNFNTSSSSNNGFNFSNSLLIDSGRRNCNYDHLFSSLHQNRRIGMVSHRIKPESYLGNMPRVVFKTPITKSFKPATVKINSNLNYKAHVKLEKGENHENSNSLAQVINRSQSFKKNFNSKEPGCKEEVIKALKDRKRSQSDDLNPESSKKKRKHDIFDTIEPMENDVYGEEEDDEEDDEEEDDEEEEDFFMEEDEQNINDKKNDSLVEDKFNEKNENKANRLISGQFSKKNGFKIQSLKSSSNNEILSSYSSIREKVKGAPMKRKQSPNQSDLSAKIFKTTLVSEIKDEEEKKVESFKKKEEKETFSQNILKKEDTSHLKEKNEKLFKSPYLHTIEEHERDMKRTQQRLGHFLKALSSIDALESSKIKEKE